MWNRIELKARGKGRVKANWLTCILASLLLTIAGGSGGTYLPSGSSSVSSPSSDTGDTISNMPNMMDEQMMTLMAVVLGVMGIVCCIVVALKILVFNPLIVGLKKFFLDNASRENVGLDGTNMGLAFSDKWGNVVGVMFVTHFFVFLWSLLLIIPGIYKSYEWRMVSFLLAENPDMSGEDARQLSAQMMNGSKWEAFILDLSFIGWILLGVVTFGIVNLVWTNPYRAATDAELYMALKNPNRASTDEAYSDDLTVEFVDQYSIEE